MLTCNHQKCLWSPNLARCCRFQKYFKTEWKNVKFHVESGHLIFSASQMTGFYLKYNNGLKDDCHSNNLFCVMIFLRVAIVKSMAVK